MKSKIILRFAKLFFLVGFFATSKIYAQEVQKSEVLKNYFEPRVKFQINYTNNIDLNDSNKDGYAAGVSPGFIWIGNSNRLKGFLDYSLDSIFSSRKESKNYISNKIYGFATLEILDKNAFLDINGSLQNQKISAFDYPVDQINLYSNTAKVKSYKISPFYKGDLSDNISYEIRTGISKTTSDSVLYSSEIEKFSLINFVKSPENSNIGWELLADYKNSEFTNQRNIKNDKLKVSVSYVVNKNLIITGIVGNEKTNQLSLDRNSYTIKGLSAKWRPSEQTLLSSRFEKRYFGNAHDIIFEHQTGKTIWRYKDINGISNENRFSQRAQGSIYDLIDNYYYNIEPDKVQRTKLVLNELERLGLSSNARNSQDYFRSGNTLEKIQEISLVLFGLRSSITFEAFQTKNKKLENSFFPGIDFNLNEQIFQHGWNLMAAHRLTPISAIFINISRQQNKGSALGFKSNSRVIKFGLNTQVARKANLNFQIGRSLFQGIEGNNNESSITGTLTYRF